MGCAIPSAAVHSSVKIEIFSRIKTQKEKDGIKLGGEKRRD